MKFGLDRLIADRELRAPLRGRRVGLLAHPASVTEDLTHALDALAACGGISYWALAHPPGKPDFHHADGFALELSPGAQP